MRGGAGAHAEFLHAHLLRVFWRLLLWLHGGRLVPQRFDFSFAQPLHAMSYGRIFSGTLCFGQPRTAAWFDADAFKQPVRRDRDALQSFLRATPGNVVGPHLNERSASARVRMVLQRASPEWPDLAVTAQRLHMSVSALQRHLATEGTSFQALKDQLRRDMAIVRLTSSEASLIAIAADLGFTDSTAFQRAFKVWTGSAPGAYRARSRSGSTLHRGIRPIPARPRGCSRPLKDRRLHSCRALAHIERGSRALKRLFAALAVAPTASQRQAAAGSRRFPSAYRGHSSLPPVEADF